MLKSSQAKHNGIKMPKIWEVKVNNMTFQIDGQIHESDSREWQVLEITKDCTGCEQQVWIDTVRTKKEGLELIEEIVNKNK